MPMIWPSKCKRRHRDFRPFARTQGHARSLRYRDGTNHDYGDAAARAAIGREWGAICLCGFGGRPWQLANGTRTMTSKKNHLRKAAETDKPVAGLLKDLKRRGLLESTLVLWGGEFGRSPEAQSGKAAITTISGSRCDCRKRHQRRTSGRSHGCPWASSGREPLSFPDIHATILHQLGLDQHQ